MCVQDRVRVQRSGCACERGGRAGGSRARRVGAALGVRGGNSGVFVCQEPRAAGTRRSCPREEPGPALPALCTVSAAAPRRGTGDNRGTGGRKPGCGGSPGPGFGSAAAGRTTFPGGRGVVADRGRGCSPGVQGGWGPLSSFRLPRRRRVPAAGHGAPAGSAALARSVPAEPRSAAQPAPAPTAASQISCGEAISDPTPSPGRENIARSPRSPILSAPSFAGMVGLS